MNQTQFNPQHFLRRATYNKVSDLINLTPNDGFSSVTLNHNDSGTVKGRRVGGILPCNNGFNFCLLVGKVEVVVDQYRVDGTRLVLAQALVGDETASISLRVQENNIDLLRAASQNNGAIVLRNVSLEMNRGKHLRLIISKFGRITSHPDNVESTPSPPLFINKEINVSTMEIDTKSLMRRSCNKVTSHDYDYLDADQVGKQNGKEFPSNNIRAPFTNGLSQPYLVHNNSMNNFNPSSHIFDSSPIPYNPYVMMTDPNVMYVPSSSWIYNPMDHSSIWFDHS